MTYVLDGGPGTGKTSILKELGKQGHTIVREAARPIIAREQRRQEKDPAYQPTLPWTDFMGFQYEVARTTIDRLRRAQEQPSVFTDRHLPAQVGYASRAGVDVPTLFYDLIAQHPITQVFIPERLPYTTDDQRLEDEEFARELHESVTNAYRSMGAHITVVPTLPRPTVQDSIVARADYVLEHLAVPEKDTEIEQKFRVPHRQVRKNLLKYHTIINWAGREDTWVVPQENGYERLRIRGQEAERTIKQHLAPHTRYEHTAPIPVKTAERLAEQPEIVHYTNHTEQHQFLADAHTAVTLDHIVGVGEFVEIEGSSLERILQVKQLLGITAQPEDRPYWRMQPAA